MLLQPLLEKLRLMKLTGMAHALQEQGEQPSIASLSFEERFGLLVEYEKTQRDNRQLKRRLNRAHFKYPNACIEDIYFNDNRGIDRQRIARLATGDWIRKKRNIIVTGAAGTGKSYLACALGVSACMQGHDTYYCRLPRLLSSLAMGHGDGSYFKQLHTLNKKAVLIVDDWCATSLETQAVQDLFEVLDDRYEQASTLVLSQVPVVNWHDCIGNATVADALLDRLVHSSYKFTLVGESLRKEQWEKIEKAEEQTPIETPSH